MLATNKKTAVILSLCIILLQWLRVSRINAHPSSLLDTPTDSFRRAFVTFPSLCADAVVLADALRWFLKNVIFENSFLVV